MPPFLWRGVPDVVEEDVGAEPLGWDDAAVVEVSAIEVGVVPDIRGLADATATMAVDLGESAILGAVGVIVAQVPFAEHAGGVAGVFEDLADGDLVLAEHGAAHDGMPDAGAIGPMAGEKGGAGGGAGGGDVVVGEDGLGGGS